MRPTFSPPPDARVWFAVAILLVGAGVLTHFSQGHPSLMLGLNHASQLMPDMLWSCITVSGLGWAVLILVSIMSRGDLGARLVVTGFVLGGIVTHTLKPWLGLPRPGVLLDVELIHFIGNPVINHHSMPSGHALAALCMGTLWICLIRAHAYPRWMAWLAWAIALTIAASRIAVGAHWPADVLVGGGLGLMVGWVAWRFPFPWPSRNDFAFPWLPVLVEGVGAWAAFTFDEGMPLALVWQWVLGGLAVASMLWRVQVWWALRTSEAAA